MDIKKNCIHVIGAEGFIGKNIQSFYTDNNLIKWSHSTNEYNFDIYDQSSWEMLFNSNPQKILFLSWPGLPNYDSTLHLVKNLPAMINFFEELVRRDVKRIVVTGTCYEYGSMKGKLSEDFNVEPINQYAIAKNTLRQVLQNLCHANNVSFAWARLFYPYGEFQNPKSLIPSLIRAIKNNEKFFTIGAGDQIRDFISIEKVVNYLLFLVNNRENEGIFNIGSGKPTSIKSLVNEIVENENSNISILENLDKNRKNEPQEFWADMTKLNNLYK